MRRQIALNRSVAGNWELFALHRQRTTDLIVSAAGAGPRSLCVLGAGNCNDLDLRRLLGTFAHVDLIDLDLDAMRAGVRRQAVPDERIGMRRDDLSGVADRLRRWSEAPPTNDEIDRWLLELEDDPPPVMADRVTADVAVSAGLLSQMTGMTTRILGLDHPRAVEVALALRDAHLRHLVRLVASPGAGLVITDIASPSMLDRVDASHLAALTDRLVRSGQVTTGTNPLGIETFLRAVGENVSDVRRHDPWTWRVTATKSQLVVAISFRRAPA